MRWELRDPWSNAVYCCVACYGSGGQEHNEWDISYAQTRPCTSEWPDEVLTALFGPPPLTHQHPGPTDGPVASIHLAAHMDDAAESDSDDDAAGYQLAELIYGRLHTATRHANAPTVVRITVLHLLHARDLANAVVAPVAGCRAPGGDGCRTGGRTPLHAPGFAGRARRRPAARTPESTPG